MFKKKNHTEEAENHDGQHESEAAGHHRHHGHKEKDHSEEMGQEEAPVDTKDEKIRELEDKYLRLYADFENYRRRTSQERLDLMQSANKDMVIAVLPVFDDLERAITSLEKTSDVEAVKHGISLIFNKFKHVLHHHGLREIESNGQPFDADLHDAIAKIPAPDDMKGKVVDEVQKGYMLNNKIIRHAKVVVGE